MTVNNKKIIGSLIFWITYPAIYLLLRNSHRTRVIVKSDDKILFVRTFLGDGKLSLPGGGIKKSESSTQAATRELKEETNIEVDIKDLKLVSKNVLLSEKGIKYYADCYFVNVPKPTETSSRHLEIIESIWLPWKQNIDTIELSNTTNQLLHAWMVTPYLVD